MSPILHCFVRPRAAGVCRLLALVGACCAALCAQAAEPPVPSPPTDPVLRALIDETLARVPEVKQAEARVRAAQERVPQAGALADPMVTVGIQNDGFERLELGRMETSYVSIMATQPLPWPGKTGLRTEVAELGAKATSARATRARLSAEAEVRRAYLDLLLVRERRALLDELATLWTHAEAAARARYETGEAPQSDVLRAQLECARIEQRRFALDAEERQRLAALNRLRGHALDEPIASGSGLKEWPVPGPRSEDEAAADALARSPEVEEARWTVAQDGRAAALARKSIYPDLVVGAGVMPRGGPYETMWQANVGVTLPVFAGRKQHHEVAEADAQVDAATQSAEAIRQRVTLRARQRQAQLAAAGKILALYRNGLLVQSRATVDSTLAQYAVGRVPFASVLEAVSGYLGDEDAFLQAAAEAQRLLVAEVEVSVDEVAIANAAPASSNGM